MIRFPEGFLWGSATSAPQSEGRLPGDGKGQDIWDFWHREEPWKFFREVGPDKTSTMQEHFSEDIPLMKACGHNSFRTSISWARLIPDGTGAVNREAVKFYRAYFTALREAGIRPFINLYHFDMPLAQQRRGGFETRKGVTAFADYAETCFREFGDLVDDWFTFNEPIVHTECGYLYQYHYPMKVDPAAAARVGYHSALASAAAIRRAREIIPEARIGIVLNLTPAYPRSEHPADLEAARIAELFANKSFLDPALRGHYPEELVRILHEHGLLPETQDGDKKLLAENTVDYLGVNYYQPLRVAARASLPNPAAPFTPGYYYDHYEMPGRKMNPYRGWEIYEQGIYDIACNLRENYGNPLWLVSENGMGVADEQRFLQDGVIQDDYRIDFYKGHLRRLHQAIAEGSRCFGYHVWTFIDCWSWLNAYKNRYGLVSLNLETQTRTIKKSGHWFAELAQNNGFE